ncbi:MAG: ERCC4 domain-containing protein [Dehalococcoidia bacterium]|nr:ERCC4 domain-containing protein [Dehalococcoidia bacterium]
MTQGIWILERCVSDRFPYRLQIMRGEKPWLILRTQDRWPTVGRNIFCLREEEPPPAGEVLEEIERVPVIAFHERGRRVSIILDRKRYKRCDFLFLTKSYKRKPGETYEQVFWLTQRSIEQHRPSTKLTRYPVAAGMTIRIASDERYPWRFPIAHIERRLLPVGDYALVDGDRVLAVIERKTFDNLLADFGIMPVLHQRLAELTTHENHAFVIEALYSDFLNPKKVRYYTADFCARAIAEIYSLHPRLRVVFCGNRKLANEWARYYFFAVLNQRQMDVVSVP